MDCALLTGAFEMGDPFPHSDEGEQEGRTPFSRAEMQALSVLIQSCIDRDTPRHYGLN